MSIDWIAIIIGALIALPIIWYTEKKYKEKWGNE